MDKNAEYNLDSEIENIKTTLINPLVEEQLAGAPPSPFKSREQQVKELQDRYLSTFKQSLEMTQATGKEILDDPKFGIKLPKDLNKLIRNYTAQFKAIEAAAKSGNIEELPKEIPTLQETLKISDESLEKIYASALEFYQHRDFEKATRYCLFAINLNSQYPNFWAMLAICEEHQQHWNEAYMGYTMAGMLDPINLDMHVGAVRTQIQAGRPSEAESYATQVCDLLEQAGEKEKASELKALLKTLNIA